MSIAKRIVETSKIYGSFTLRSGKVADSYFDKYRFEADPQLLADITAAMVGLVPPQTEVLAGLELGGIPLVTMLSQQSGLPCAFLRKEAKAYGTCKYAEGTDLPGKKILLVEDVVSSGGALLDQVAMLRNDGIAVATALCVIDRETGGYENLQEVGIELISLYKQSAIERAAVA